MSLELDSTTVIRPATFAHVVLRTRHLEQSIAWYQSLIGMEVVFRNAYIAFLTYDDEHHRLALASTPQEESAPPGAAGLDHIAFTFRSLEQLLGTYVRLKKGGVLPVWAINHGPTTSLYYQDPDGNRAELQVDNFANREELNAWFQTDSFVKNPIGVEFDAEKMVTRFEEGVPVEELLKQGAA
jgi:catechol-2,3-dioxygenase